MIVRTFALLLASSPIASFGDGCSFFLPGAAISPLPEGTNLAIESASRSLPPAAKSALFASVLIRSHLPIRGSGSIVGLWETKSDPRIADSGIFEYWTVELPHEKRSFRENESLKSSALSGMFSSGGAFWEIGVGSYSSSLNGEVEIAVSGSVAHIHLNIHASAKSLTDPSAITNVDKDLELHVPVISFEELPALERRCLKIKDAP